MEKEISAYSMHQAFAYLCKEARENDEEYPKQFIDIAATAASDLAESTVTKLLNDLGICVGECIVAPGANPNQTQTQVKDTIIKGDKKWKTAYLAVFDTPWGDEVVPGSQAATKKECVDVVRAICAEQNRDAFVIIGKKPDGFVRCQATVLYKPSPKQTVGVYKFTW